MPIQKVAVVHKFGIISHSQRLELQERLLKQSYLQTLGSKKAQPQSRNPLEVTDEFVQEYNAASDLDEKERLDDVACKMLQRIKRRVGLRDAGKGNHVDLPVAWTELSQLAQCKGSVQEECLDILIASLDQAPVQRVHVPALFFLAETTLYWLRTDAVNQPYLRTAEIKLLKMGQLVFTRLFYHHMAGQLHGHKDFKGRLFNYLDGFSESQEAYNPYPNALLCLRYISEVGKMILADVVPDPGDVKEGDNVVLSRPQSSQCDSQLFHEVSANFEGTRTSRSGAISSSVHDLSPTLWHSLDVWRCVNNMGGGLQEALRALAKCGTGLASESWIDGVCALHVLGDAARNSLPALKVMMNLARGLVPRASEAATSTQELVTTEGTTGDNGYVVDIDAISGQSSKQVLSDIYEKTETGSSHLAQPSKRGETSHQKALHPSEELSWKTSLEGSCSTFRGRGASGVFSGTTQMESSSKSFPMTSPTKSVATKGSTSPTKSAATNKTVGTEGQATAWRPEVGSEFGSGRGSQASSVPTFTNAVYPEFPGLHGWHWEVAFSYADMLVDITLHGKTSSIQKLALVGMNKEVGDLHRRSTTQIPMKSAGLLDLVYFRAVKEQDDNGPNDWSWRVRYAAIQGLVRVCRCCAGDASREGVRTVAWNTLVRAHSLEKDQRVLEALKVGQVDAGIESLMRTQSVVNPTAIGAKIAQGLSVIYLPPLPPPVAPPPAKKEPDTSRKIPLLSEGKHSVRKPLRTSLKEEIMLATTLYEPPVGFNTRTDFDLQRIVEDQWRKDLQTQLAEEEKEREKELAEKQKQEEQRQEEVEALRKQKLGSKYKGPAYGISTGHAGRIEAKVNGS